MSEQRTDNRQANHIEVYRSEAKTLARTSSILDDPNENYCQSAQAYIRVIKSDLRLPMTFYVGFDPDGGDPNKASIIVSQLNPPKQPPALRAAVAELILCRRSYIPIMRVVGSILDVGKIEIPSRPGALGFAYRVSDECDAVEFSVELPCALGDIKGYETGEDGRPDYSLPIYFGGRWVCGYSFTTNERLSREEWTTAVTGTNMMVEVCGGSNAVEGIPTIIKEQLA